MIFCLYIFAEVCEGDLDLVSTFLVQSLTFFKDMTGTTIWSMSLHMHIVLILCGSLVVS